MPYWEQLVNGAEAPPSIYNTPLSGEVKQIAGSARGFPGFFFPPWHRIRASDPNSAAGTRYPGPISTARPRHKSLLLNTLINLIYTIIMVAFFTAEALVLRGIHPFLVRQNGLTVPLIGVAYFEKPG